MQGNKNSIQLIGFLMSKQTLDANRTLDLVQILNGSFASSKDIITILQDIFKHQKSGKILLGVQILQYLIKNCNRHFHNAANRQSFQKRLLSLLNRIRGKTSIIKQLNSNTDNWCRIEAKVLYIIQLWYDAFILEESKYPHIINNYKVLRKQNVTFPPRSSNEKNLLYVQTQSPIFDNIEQIANQDQKKFNKKLTAMGMGHLKSKMESNVEHLERLENRVHEKKHSSNNNNLTREVNIDEISEKIAIIQSSENPTLETLKVIEQLKKTIEFGKVKPNQEQYWKEVKNAAQKLVEEWESRNAQLVQSEEQKYLQKKLGMMGVKREDYKKQQQKKQIIVQERSPYQVFDLLEAADEMQYSENQVASNCLPLQSVVKNQVNLLDL